jgi:type IV pilus assembly protein PilM
VSGRRAVGLDIGTTSVRAAQLSWSKDRLELERFGQVALPLGAVRDGEVVDPAAVSAALRELWTRSKFTSKKVVAGVANQKVVVRQLDLPWMEMAELRKSLAFLVADVLPMPIEQAILDVHPLEEVETDDGRRQRVLLVAADRGAVNSLMEGISGAGLTPSSIDLTSFAVLRALAAVDDLGLGQGAEALVDVGASVTNIVVSQGGIPRFVRILLMGGADITETVADRMGVPIEQAEAIKQATALPLDPAYAGADPVVRVVEAAATSWVDEVRGSLDYYLAQTGATRLSRILLSGGGSQLRGLAGRLSMATRLPVEPGAPLAALHIGKTGLSDAQLDYAHPMATVPVGLAMAGVS